MKVVIPKTRSTLKILEPMILPTARSDFFLKAATAEVASSGKEVPAARIVRPINFSLTSKCLAIMTSILNNELATENETSDTTGNHQSSF